MKSTHQLWENMRGLRGDSVDLPCTPMYLARLTAM